MRPILVLLCIVGICNSAFAKSLPWQDLPKIGQAKLKFAVWNVYRADLFGDHSAITDRQNFALKLTYLRAFSSQEIVKETQKQLVKLNEVNKNQIRAWASELEMMWPDIHKGDSLTLFVDERRYARFYFNGSYIGSIENTEFSYAFSNIWLSENTSRPKLRLALLGQSLQNGKTK